MSNLPPGCTINDIERDAVGSCPDCGAILCDDRAPRYCKRCGWEEDDDDEGNDE